MAYHIANASLADDGRRKIRWAARHMPVLASKLGSCFASNKGSATAELLASRTCCRVPGR